MMEVLHEARTDRLEIGEQRHAIARALEIVQRQLDVRGSRHRDQMQDGIGRSADRHHEHDCILERLLGDDVERLEVLLQKRLDGTACAMAFVALPCIFGGGGRAVRQR